MKLRYAYMLAALFALVSAVEAPPKKKKGAGSGTTVRVPNRGDLFEPDPVQAAEGRSWLSCCLPWGSRSAVAQPRMAAAPRKTEKKYRTATVHAGDTAVDEGAGVFVAPSTSPARASQHRVAFAVSESDNESGRGRSRSVRNRRLANAGRDSETDFSVPGLLGAQDIQSSVTGADLVLQTPLSAFKKPERRGGYSSASSATMTGSSSDAATGAAAGRTRPVPKSSLPVGRSVLEMMSGYDASRVGDSDEDFEAHRPPKTEFTGSRARRAVRRLDMDKVVVAGSHSGEAPDLRRAGPGAKLDMHKVAMNKALAGSDSDGEPALPRGGVSPAVAVQRSLPAGLSASSVRHRQLKAVAERRRGEERSKSPRTSPRAAYTSPSASRPVGRRGARPLHGLTSEQMTGDESVDVKKLAAAEALNRDAHRRMVTRSPLGTAQSPKGRKDSRTSPVVEDDGTVLQDFESGSES